MKWQLIFIVMVISTGAHSADSSSEVGRGHGGMTYVNWTFGTNRMTDLSMDITFHCVPQPSAAVYVQLYDFNIGNTRQYFGFQYTFDEAGQLATKFIWTRWGTRDKANAWVEKGGSIESAGYEGDFVGLRYRYRWGKGAYTVTVMMRNVDEVGAWYEMKIYDHQEKEWLTLGRLRFPKSDGDWPYIQDGGGSWCEVFGGTKTSRDIGFFHLSYDGVYTRGRTLAAREAHFSYGDKTPNSDIAVDEDEQRIHVIFGGETIRRHPGGSYLFHAGPVAKPPNKGQGL